VSVLVVGSVALDTIRTPEGDAEGTLGGSASYASLAARLFAPTAILGVVGEDFPAEHLRMFAEEGIDASGVEVVAGGKTFHWEGRYHEDMNTRDTLRTDLNVLATHHPDVPERLRETRHLFLANTDPDLQLQTLSQCSGPRLVVADTMTLWIECKRDALWEMISRADVFLINDGEARDLCETPNLVRAGRRMLEAGAGRVIIKKGEHGCLMMTAESIFAGPAYPLREVRDPTGAGDSFAGAYLGHLAQCEAPEEGDHRRAIIAGAAAGSFNCESFGVERLRSLTPGELRARCDALMALMSVEGMKSTAG
jgi:sugar/nucleoside kinase (ribokinase family)